MAEVKFPVTPDGIKQFEEYKLKLKKESTIVDVFVDPSFKYSKDSNYVAECQVCKSLFLFPKEELKYDERTGVFNVERACDVCGYERGYNIVGKLRKEPKNAE